MVRLANEKYDAVQLAVAATIHADEDGKAGKYPAGSWVLTNRATGKVKVVPAAVYATTHETVNGVVRPKSSAYTAVQATAQATITTADGRVQRAFPGDWLVTNGTTGEVQVYRPDAYAKAFE